MNHNVKLKAAFRRLLLVLAAAGFPLSACADHGVSAGNINVVQLDAGNTVNSVQVTTSLAINDFRVRDGSNRGDYSVKIGAAAEDDAENGILLSSVTENGRNNFGTNNYPISTVHAGTVYRIGSFVPTEPIAGSAAEYNVNVAGAWFPYSRFIGGVAKNSVEANGGTNDVFTGSLGLVLGTHLRFIESGKYIVDLTSFGIDSRTDGILLATHAKDENNFALSQVNEADGTWNLFLRDNAQPTYANYEQDPVGFVYIPKTNSAFVSGRFKGDASIAAFNGSSPQFTVSQLGTGRWELKIPGESPLTGVLILSAEGGGTYNGDNIVSYQANSTGDGWEIQSRDTPNNGLQTPTGAGGEPEAVASFVFIPGPAAILISPPDNAQNIGASPLLAVALSNSVPGPLSVSLYGREAPTPYPGQDFAIVILPDTQYYSAERFGGKREMFIAQAEWIVTNTVSRNIAYVVHLGDISDSGDIKNGLPNLTEWRNVTNAMYRLENPTRTQLPEGMPYGLAVGNHDQEPIGDPTGTTIFYNQYFGISHFTGRSYYAGHYGSNNNNHFDFFSAGGLDFVAIYFEYFPGGDPAVLAWANEVLRTNAHRRAIAVTHYMGSARTPSTHSAQGAAIYNALKGNTNLFLLLGGHVSGEGSRQDIYNGNIVRTFISDYQSYTNGGNGFLRIMDFSPSNNVVTIQTFSPWSGEYETDEDSEMFFSYNLQPPGGTGSPGTEFVPLGSFTGVMPGNVVTSMWSGLIPQKIYEWYAVVTDSDGNSSVGPTWRFYTAANVPPVANNQLVRVPGDAPASLLLVASDANGDVLTFRTNTFPTRGINVNFNTNAGTITYIPARGYRGTDRFTYQAHDGLTNSSTATLNLVVEQPADTNANGLPDAWETTFGVSDPNDDDDGDGQSNLGEYMANTNPTNAASVFQIISAGSDQAGHFNVSWSSIGGTRYRVQYTDSFPTGAFTDIVRPLAVEMDGRPYGTAGTQTFIDDFSLTGQPPPFGARYYRIKLSP